MTPEQFAQFVDIGLIALFISITVAFLLSAFIGYKKGVWSTTFRFIFIGLLIVGSIISLSAMSEVVGKLPIGNMIPYKSLTITNENSGEYYNVTITNISDTLYESFKGYYLLFNMSSNPAQAHAFAVGMTTSVLKLVTFFVMMLLIVTIGNLLCTILWHCAFKHIIPKLARKRIKGRWISFAQNMVIYVVSTFMLLAPVTSLVNVTNATYRRNSQGASDGYITYVDKFLNAYDNSLFAQTFFNWNTNSGDLSFDSQFMDAITKVTIEGTETSIIDTVHDITEIASYFSNSIIIKDGGVTVDLSIILDKELMTRIFQSLKDSYVVTYLLPIGVDFALTLDEVQKVVDPSLINVSDYNWKNEISNIENIYFELLDSGLVADLANQTFTTTEDFIRELLRDEKYPGVTNALKKIDDSQLLTRSLEAVVYAMTQNNEDAAQFFPSSINELDDIDWGFELSVVFDTLYRFNKIDDRFLHAILNFNADSLSPSPAHLNIFEAKRDATPEPELIELLVEHLGEVQDLLVGETDSNNQIINVDSEGRTIVYTSSGKVAGRFYNIFDLKLSKYLLSPLGKYLADAVGGDVDEITAVYQELFQNKWRLNLKQEFAHIFHALKPFQGHYAVLEDLLNGNFPSDLSGFSDELVLCMAATLPRMDFSKILSCVFYDKVIEAISNSRTTLEEFGLHYDLIEEGMNVAADAHILGREIAPIILRISDINNISSVLSDSSLSSDDLINALGGDELNMSLARILDAMYSSSIINYSHDESDKDTNYFYLMEHVFTEMNVDHIAFFDNDYTTFRSLTADLTFVNTVNPDGTLTYDGENGYLCNVIKVLKETSILAAIGNDPDFFENNDNYILLAKPLAEGGLDLPYLLKSINDSIIFSYTIGDFLDNQLSMVVDLDVNVTFRNVTDWEDEGLRLKDVLLAVGYAPDIKLNDLDLQSIHDIVGLNNILHYLVRSNIFVDKTDPNPNTNYRFGDWLYKKVQSSLSEFEFESTSYDLVKDPSGAWDSDWGSQDGPDSGYNILYHDFIYSTYQVRRTICDWIGDYEPFYSLPNFNTDEYITGSYTHYYDNPSFYPAYSDYLFSDELGNIINTVYWAGKVAEATDITNIPSDAFSGLLNALNETNCLRILVYNFYEIAKQAFNDGGGTPFFDLEPAQTKFLINCGSGMWDFDDYYDVRGDLIEGDRSLRRKEIDCLCELYDLYKTAEAEGIFSSSGFDVTKMGPTFSRRCSNALVKLNESEVFHRQGPATGDTTVFQNGIIAFLTKMADVKNMIYSANSPKDIYNVQQAHLYTDADSKANYLSLSLFPYSTNVDGFDAQKREIKQLFEVVSSVIGGYKGDSNTEKYGKLVDASGEYTLNFNEIDWTRQSNVDAVKVTLEEMNKSELLFDAVPNAIYEALATNSHAITDSLPSGVTAYIDLKDANIYHNYFEKTTSGYTFDFSKRLTDEDLDVLGFLLQEISLYENGSPACKIPTDFTDFSYFGDDIHAQDLQELLEILADSDIFHSSSVCLTFNAAGEVVEKKEQAQTVFQEILMQFLATSEMKNIIYNVNSPKDIANGYTSYPFEEAVAKKCYDMIKSVFPAENGLDSRASREIGYMKDFFQAAARLNTLDFASESLQDINIDDAADVLTSLNNSDLLFDGVPNILYKLFSSASSFESLDGVDFSKASPYFVYQYGGVNGDTYIATPSYNRHYPDVEINNLKVLMSAYVHLANKTSGHDFNDFDTLGKIIDEGDLMNTLQATYNSYVLHRCNDYKDNSEINTVFEDTIAFLLNKSGMTDFMYEDNPHGYATKDAYITAKIKSVSNYDFHPGTFNTTGYHERWFTLGSAQGEVNALIDFVNTGRIVLTSGGSYDFANALLENISPDNVYNLMTIMNNSDLVSDALPVFVKNGFSGSSIGISSLATYGGNEKTNYYLTQYQYGGPKEGKAGYKYEIDLIYEALLNMAKTDSSGNFVEYEQFSDIEEFMNHDHIDNIEGIMQYVTMSMILNGEEWVLHDGHHAKTRGLIFYNILHLVEYDTTNHYYLDDLIIGNTGDERIFALSEIFNISDFNSTFEAKGLYKLMVDNGQAIRDINGCLSDTSSLMNYAPVMTNLIECSYNADGYNHRSYLVSQLVGGIMNKVIAQEEAKSYSSDIPYSPIRYGPIDIDDINSAAYNTVRNSGGTIYAPLNATEKDGALGALRLEKVVERIKNSSADKPTQQEVKEVFALMGKSYLGKVLYTFEVDSYVNSVAASTRDNYASHIFDTGYDFTNYGIDLAPVLAAQGLIV